MTKPQYAPPLSLGHILTMISLLAAGAIAFGEVQGQAAQNAAAVTSLAAQVDGQETRLRVVETEIARSDERLSNILTLLSRIDNRLERIERRDRPR